MMRGVYEITVILGNGQVSRYYADEITRPENGDLIFAAVGRDTEITIAAGTPYVIEKNQWAALALEASKSMKLKRKGNR